MEERDYVGPDFRVHYRQRNDSPILPKLFFGAITVYILLIVVSIVQSAN